MGHEKYGLSIGNIHFQLIFKIKIIKSTARQVGHKSEMLKPREEAAKWKHSRVFALRVSFLVLFLCLCFFLSFYQKIYIMGNTNKQRE